MLSNFSDGDMDVVVRCVHQLDNFHNPTSVNRRVMRPFERMGGDPSLFTFLIMKSIERNGGGLLTKWF
jgi:hypothetical protein